MNQKYQEQVLSKYSKPDDAVKAQAMFFVVSLWVVIALS